MRNSLRVCSAVLILLGMTMIGGSRAQAEVAASPASIDFGSVNVNTLSSPTVITITNNGTRAAFLQSAASNLSQFLLAGPALPMVLQVNQSASFQVVFMPSNGRSIAGNITFTMARSMVGTVVVPVSGKGLHHATATYLLSSSATSLSLGPVLVGSATSQAVTLSNTGNSSVMITSLGVSGTGYSVSGMTAPATIAAGQSVSLAVGYAPVSAGTSTGSIQILSNASNSPTTTIALNGTAVQPQISVVPGSIGFGSVTVGVSNTQTVTVKNTGTANLIISQAAISGAGFSATGISLPLTVTPSASMTFTVGFNPATAGSLGGTLTLVSNAPNSTLAVALSGTGVAQTRTLSSSPAAVSFGSLAENTSSTQPITLSNTGNAAVTISTVNVSGAGFSYSGMSLPITLAAGQSTSFNTVFDPTTAGNRSGSIAIVSTASNPISIALSGTGAAPATHTIELSWTASTSTVAGYNVYSGAQSGGPYTRVNGSTSAATSYSETNVASGETLYFVTTAVDASGNESAYSNQAVAIVP